MKVLIVLFLMIQVCYAGLYEISETTIDGQEISMSQFKDQVVLIVNIASQCGYTPQLENLEKIYQKYKGQKFTIIGVPTNDFMGQTPEEDKAIKEYCQKKYGVTFPLLKKQTIQGKEKRKLYKYLTEDVAKKFQGEVSWNFEKFLFNKKGELVGRFRPSMDPMDKKITSLIEQSLK